MKAFAPESSLVLFLMLFSVLTFPQVEVTGELRKWHTVTLAFSGPFVAEQDPVNPFLDYRLNVIFTSPSGIQWVVPGFFAADGNAANSGATSGNKWHVRFTPNETGTWTYSASFRTGDEIAISLNENEGTPTAFNSETGTFTTTGSDKVFPDNRARGRLNYIGEHYLQYEETKAYFIKVGADSPENLLAFSDFDNTLNKKDWSPHVRDWNSGDPTWKNSQGKGIIGAINYLSGKGMNAFSFLTMNVKGDGKDVWPWTSSSNNNLDGNSGNDAQNRLRYDVSKLEQWEILFAHADTKGMFLHFKTQETENDQLLDGGNLGVERKLYYRELIARFGHHLALNWNVGEENTQTTNQRKEAAQYIKAVDPYDHHIVIHTYPNQQDEVYNPLLGNSSEYSGPSVQSGINNIHRDVKKWVETSRNSEKKWAVANDEQGNAQVGVAADNSYSGDTGNQADNRKNVRYKALWGTLLAGGYGVEYYFGYGTGETDLTAQDFRSRATKWEDAKIAYDFFTQNIPFWEMVSSDNLISDSDAYCFATIGEVYVIYLPNGGTTNLNLTNASGMYTIKWFQPATGGSLEQGTKHTISGSEIVNLGDPPRDPGEDWVIVVENNNRADDEPLEDEIIAINQLEINPKVATVFVGDTLQLALTISPSNASNTSVIWSSQNPEVATVDTQGLITGITEGSALITVSVPNSDVVQDIRVTVIPVLELDEPLVFPNPVMRSDLGLQIAGIPEGTYEIRFFTLDGKLALRRVIGINSIYTMDVSSLREGVYIFSMRNADQVWEQKILIR
ncbi:MAG: DUF5060 domain-containing protein [Bacteroidota bacterium]